MAMRRPRYRLDIWRLAADLYPVSRRSLAAQVADQIRRKITNGDLRPGQRIESSRKLAQELQVSLPVVREALSALSYMGMIEIRHGVGAFVTRRPRVATTLGAAHRHARRTELHDIRAILAAETAARAARRRRSERQELDLHMLLVERDRSVIAGEPSAFVQADLDLHAFVAGMSGSALHAALERMAGVAVRTDMTGRARQLALDPQLDELHRNLVDAIEASDPDGARSAATAIAIAEGAQPD
jgi:DNA-binding FadR family transcriptional regulator